MDRCVPFVDYNLRALQPRFKEEAYQDVIGKMTEKILSGDQGDFFEVRFQCALERLSISEFGRYFRIQRMEEIIEPNDPSEDICEELAQEEEQYDPFVSPELNAKLWEGIGKLNANRREAFILRYKDDWPIESEDPKTPTISKYFERTPRTIRNWLAEAKEFLRQYCERGE
jgi:DNA-directed RNA polymerase specialized sigma24 family protein